MADDFSGWALTPADETAGWTLHPAGTEGAAPPAPPRPLGRAMAALKGVQDVPTLGFGDELGGAIQAGLMALPGGVRQALGGSKYVDPATFAENYSQARDVNRAESSQARAEHPGYYYGAGLVASVPTMLVTPSFQAAKGAPLLARALAAAKTGGALGMVGGAGASEADTLEGVAKDAGLGGLAGLTVGGAAPVAAEYAGRYLPHALRASGNAVKNAAGVLKVNSLHPVPTLSEAMEELPGGTAAAGRALLQQGLGGMTKRATATRIDTAADQAGRAITDLAAGSATPIDLVPTLDRASQHAADLYQDPLTRSAGDRLGKLVEEYQQTYGASPASPAEALELKRRLARAVYGARKELAATHSDELSTYKQGISGLERGVNETLDTALGPEFAQRNLAYRQLLGASQAADRSAARFVGNKLLPLYDAMALVGVGTAHGPGLGAAAAAGAHLAGKYGSQAGARGLYTVGQMLEAAPDKTQMLIELLRRGAGTDAPARVGRGVLLPALRPLEGNP